MKVIYYIGDSIDSRTIVKKGGIIDDAEGLHIDSKDEKILLSDIKTVELIKITGLGTMIKLNHRSGYIFITVPRIFLEIGSGFAIINYLATIKLKALIEERMQ